MNPLTYLPARFRAAYYAVYTVIGLGLGGVSVYNAANQAPQPAWLVGSLAVFGYVGIATGATALSNVAKDAPAPAVYVANVPASSGVTAAVKKAAKRPAKDA